MYRSLTILNWWRVSLSNTIVLLSRWLFCSFSYVGAGKTSLLELPHLCARFHQLPAVEAACDVGGCWLCPWRWRAWFGGSSSIGGVLSLPWFEVFQGACCERRPYRPPFVTMSTVYRRVMGRSVGRLSWWIKLGSGSK